MNIYQNFADLEMIPITKNQLKNQLNLKMDYILKLRSKQINDYVNFFSNRIVKDLFDKLQIDSNKYELIPSNIPNNIINNFTSSLNNNSYKHIFKINFKDEIKQFFHVFSNGNVYIDKTVNIELETKKVIQLIVKKLKTIFTDSSINVDSDGTFILIDWN
jgi:hypothetical protein